MGEGRTEADTQPEPDEDGDNRDGNEVLGSGVCSIYLVRRDFCKNFNLPGMSFR
jgi:hypothetical protein